MQSCFYSKFKLCRPLFLRIIIRNKLSKESENHFIARISAKYFQSNQVLHLGCHGIIMEKIDGTTNDSKLKWIDADRIGLERIQNPIEKFCMIFTVNSFQINQQNCSESFILIEPDDSCPDDSIVMDRNFISQRSLSFLSYINLKPIVLNNDKIKIKDSLAYTQVPIVEKIILVVLTKSIINENDELEISNELKKMMKKNSIIKFYHLFLYNGLIVELCGKKFMTIQYPQGDKEIDESMFNKMVHEWFLIDQKTLVKVQQVELVQSILDGMKAIKSVEQSIKNSPVYSYDHVSRKTFAGYNDQLKRCLQSIERGSGKTLLIEKILHELSHRNLIWSTITDCNEIKGKRVESLLKMFSKLFVQAVRFQPSILVFDNLDQICYSTGEENDIVSLNHRNKRCQRLSIVNDSTDFSKITIIATAESVDNLHPILRDSFVFDETIEIAELNNERKTEIIERILEKKINFLLSKQIQVDLKIDPKLISKGTKNFSIKNLINLIDLIIQSAMIHWFNNDEDVAFSSQKNDCLSISNDHFEIALQKFNTFDVPKSDQKLQSGRFLTDLGGMFEIKSKLFDLISMQMKYPNLHKQLPTRLPNSFLLYGMPGTGKTVLVEALVNEFDLNFINVKGPELLSKYIGNSEQSVRRVFQQAEQMAPCVLFFDEFDSLAPRRGHDSTGVTDRVVNQMLTLMDGLEERAANIFIIAATSRPDLIDLALLRPGRFDQTIHCPMPDSSARMDILLVLCRRLSIDIDSIPFDQLVSSTENFSNADLQALLYNALIDVSKQTSLRLKTIYQSEIEKSTSTTKVIPSTILSNENIDEDISNEFEKQQYQHRQQIISPPQLSVFSSKIEWKHI
ncbi:Peroxisome biogenesis factor 1 [Sarcoptes scabiei]|uniref:Peroxisome biogenesis factor 1 n=1 Tax=Sarcoptes scabiei TaxID=52283 RepID=A0A834RAN4_SARSC|nr:Peroxisome biogenesis factor 1 [Sarcoptes scabiei]